MRSFRPFQPPLGRNLGIAAAVGIVCGTTPCASATAPDARLALSWSAPPECPTADQLKRDVQTLLAERTLASSEPIVVQASVHATRDGRYALEFKANGQQRRIVGATCQQIADAAALLLALLIDPDFSNAVPPELETPPPEPATTAPKADPAQQTAVKPSDATARRDRVSPTKKTQGARLEPIGEVATRLDWGSWSKLEPFIVAGFGMQTLRWRVVGHAGLGKRLSLLGASNAHLDLLPMTIGLEPALRLLTGLWAFEPGVGLELGITHHRSDELAPKTHDALSLTMLALLRASREIGWNLRGWLGIAAGVPMIRPRWVNQAGDVFETFGPSIRGELGIQAGF